MSDFSKKRAGQHWYLGEQIPTQYIDRIKKEFLKRTNQDPNQPELNGIIKIDAHKLWKGMDIESIFEWVNRYRGITANLPPL